MAQPRFEAADENTPDRIDGATDLSPTTPERRLVPLAAVPKPVVASQSSLPAPVRKAATAVAVGAALQIGASLAVRLLASHAGKQGAATIAAKGLRAAGQARRPKRDAGREVAAPAVRDEPELISETLVVRRVWIRRSRE